MPPLNALLVVTGLFYLQFLLALPWLGALFLGREDIDNLRRNPLPLWLQQNLLFGLVGSAGAAFLLFYSVQRAEALESAGRWYGAAMQLQLTIDLFILVFLVYLRVGPKSGAVALAAFREGVRQPMFWLHTCVGALLMFLAVFIPYFTFGEDYLMVKQLGYDTIMLGAVLFGGLAAGQSVTDELEGRTAITVMSKPVSRRQFMLGKFAGIILAALFMFGLLGVVFEGVLMTKHWWDRLESEVNPMTPSQIAIGVPPVPKWMTEWIDTSPALNGATKDFLRGSMQWASHTLDTLPGLALCYSQVMVLVGLSIALATRLPLVVNLTTVLVVFFLAHLTPVLVSIAERAKANAPDSPVPQLIGFVAGVFNTILPDLRSFSMDPALLSDAPPPGALFAQYVGSVTLYGVVYTAIVLLFGLILFEDRDLA